MEKRIYRSESEEPASELLRPDRIIRHLMQHKELALTFGFRDFKGSYRSSYLGLGWMILSPLIMLGLFTAVFGGIFRGRFSASPDETAVDFALALFVGLSLFQTLAGTLGSAPSLIPSNVSFVRSVNFPVEILPVSSVFTIGLTVCAQLLVCAALFFLVNGYLHPEALFLVISVILMLVYCVGLSWLVSALSVFIRDLASIIPPITLVLMFWSLVFFPITSIPQAVRWSVQINPFAIIIDQSRSSFMYGVIPDVSLFVPVALGGVATFVLGYFVFMRARRAFGDVL